MAVSNSLVQSRGGKRMWSVPHIGDMGGKLHQAQECLELAGR